MKTSRALVVKYSTIQVRDAVFSKSKLHIFSTLQYIQIVLDTPSPPWHRIVPHRQCFVILHNQPAIEAPIPRPEWTCVQDGEYLLSIAAFTFEYGISRSKHRGRLHGSSATACNQMRLATYEYAAPTRPVSETRSASSAISSVWPQQIYVRYMYAELNDAKLSVSGNRLFRKHRNDGENAGGDAVMIKENNQFVLHSLFTDILACDVS